MRTLYARPGERAARKPRAAHDIASCTAQRHTPRQVLRVQVEAAYLHCAKALMCSRPWSPETLVACSVLRPMGRMIHDQASLHKPSESQEEMLWRYVADLRCGCPEA